MTTQEPGAILALRVFEMITPEETAAELANQVEKWYNGGKKKRDEIVAKLHAMGQDSLADQLIRWFDMGEKRFNPLIQRLRAFKAT